MASILVDNRTGSAELEKYFNGKAEVKRLNFADAAFVGKGPGGAPVFVGIERKKIRDLLNSMVSGRLAGHQIPGMLNVYGISYLIVEGEWRSCPRTGLLQMKYARWDEVSLGERRFMGTEVWNFLNTIEQKAGVHVRTTCSMRETAYLIESLFHWWTKKDYEEHRSHLMVKGVPDGSYIKPSLIRRVAAELPGIGHKRAIDVSGHFTSVRSMIEAGVKDWMQVKGIGSGIAEKVVKAVTDPKGGRRF